VPLSDTHAANHRGIFAMAFAMASFVINDATVKYVSQSLPGPQLILIRAMFATLLLLVVARAMGALSTAGLRAMADRRVAGRAVLDALGTFTYLTSLFHLPLGNATAINMATPLVITLLAVLAWRERVGAARWLALGAGFAGVLLIVQPSAAGFNAYALLCLAGTVLHAARDLSTRAIPAAIPSILITLASAVAVMLMAAVLTATQGWQAPTAQHLFLLAAASVFLSAGYFGVITAMRGGDVSVIAPFRYTGLLFALVLGWLVWGDVPNAMAFAGIALLVGAGLYVLHSERERSRAALEAAGE